jgi:hypothetical protein
MKFNPLYFLLLLALIAGNCQSKTEQATWQEIQSFINDTFRIDPNVKENADLLMEGQPEVRTFDDIVNNDTTNNRKKSSTVTITIVQDDINEIETTDKLRCIASLKGDTLNINIGNNSGFSGEGVTIKYTGKELSTNIYKFTDAGDPNKKKREYKTEKQKLALDKSKYSVGDSLYGYIYVRRVDNMNTKYYASGLFRAKVTK